jgi:inosine-uridine nucleoside N-ribohydrolase
MRGGKMMQLHIDTDIAGDIDDACALVMVLAWPGADLYAATTNSDDRGRKAGSARYLAVL